MKRIRLVLWKIRSGHDLVYRQTGGRTDGRTDGRTKWNQYIPLNFVGGCWIDERQLTKELENQTGLPAHAFHMVEMYLNFNILQLDWMHSFCLYMNHFLYRNPKYDSIQVFLQQDISVWVIANFLQNGNADWEKYGWSNLFSMRTKHVIVTVGCCPKIIQNNTTPHMPR